MSDYDIFRVTCKDGQAFDHAWAQMSGQGVVRVRRDDQLVATLGPHSACTIERIEGLSAPVSAGPPDALFWMLGVVAVLAAIFCVAGAVMVSTVGGGFGLHSIPPIPPPPLPPIPGKPQ